jgi:hypothetical protein
VNADGDPSRHIRHGETILAQKDVIRNDPFSFTKPGALFVGFIREPGLLTRPMSWRNPGMVVLATIVIAHSPCSSVAAPKGIDPLLAVITTMAVAILTNIHWLARPHIFSWPLTIALVAMLESERLPWMALRAAMFAFWVNLHGAFVFGGSSSGCIWPATSPSGVGDTPLRRRPNGRAPAGPDPGHRGRCFIHNPYGWHLPQHVAVLRRSLAPETDAGIRPRISTATICTPSCSPCSA